MMLLKSHKGLEYLTIQQLPFNNILTGFFTRKGGVSPAPYTSLNVSISTGDSRDNVKINKDRILEAIGKPPNQLFDVWQIHSDTVICTEEPRLNGQDPQKGDAIFTSNPSLTLLMRFADCVPILIYDPIKNVVGIIHAGWQGTVNQIALKSIQKIKAEYGCNPADIQAVIGPSIGPDHYEIGENVFSLAQPLFLSNEEILIEHKGRYYFNLWEANQKLLNRAGVNHIFQTRICTACQADRWYSHRAEAGKTGRFAAVISLSK